MAYPLEILSFKIRANGLFMQGLATNICLALSQYIIPIGIAAGSWKFYFFFIETRGATLEEINRTFDGADAVEEIKAKANEAVGVTDISEIGDSRKGGNDNVGIAEVIHVDEIREKSS